VGTPRVIVIGGGISGLSAAYDLTRAGADCTILEKQPRVGGVIETRFTDGCTLECGPDSFLSAKPAARALIKELGLEGDVIGSNDHQRTTYIWKRGALVALPEGVMMIVPSRVMPMVKSSLLSWATKIRMGLEYFRKPGESHDRSVAEFVTDHFGQETLDYLAEPLLSGVYGGDPAQLSVGGVLPRFLQMEAKYGSLVRGVLASKKDGRSKGGPSGPLFRTLKGGLSMLVDALAAKVKVCQADVETVERIENGFRVRAGGNWIDADQVIIACPAWSASGLVSGLDAKLAELLGTIDYSSSLTLSLIYRAADFDGKRAGFGFLVPKKERQRLAACTFVGTKFSYRVPDDRIVLRCFFGGVGDAAVLNESDEALIAIAREELRRMLGLTAAPISHAIARWPRSMAQYTLGHQLRVEDMRNRAAAIPGLHLAGNAYEGIGIPDCINTGRAAAKAALISAS
jgi:protoporphyrinogen/coproporphyrinogen III oxidase